MTRRLIKHRLPYDPAFHAALAAAYESLDAPGKDGERGRKGKVLDAADITRMTASRIINGVDDSYDTIESLRLAVNAELGSEVVPPPFIPVRSTVHATAAQLLRGMDERGDLARLEGWIAVGVDLADLDMLDTMLEVLRRRVAAQRELQESSDAIGVPTEKPRGSVSSRRGT